MKQALTVLIAVVLTGCASYGGETVELPSGMKWTQGQIAAFSKWDEQGSCNTNLWVPKRAMQCMIWRAMAYCDRYFAQPSSWRTSGRREGYMSCAEDRYEVIVEYYYEQRQQVGQGMMSAGVELLKEPPAGPDYICTPEPIQGPDAYRCVED